MKYDVTDIPANYDRGRDHGPAVLNLWMDVIEAQVRPPVRTILDLGCGTGRFSAGLADRFRARVVGIDPSEKMLQQARLKDQGRRIWHARGAAEAIPLRDGSVDVVFMSMSFHHFEDRARSARECRRILAQGGTIVVRTGTREAISSYAYVPFFPSTQSMLETLLPGRDEVCAVFEDAGFHSEGSQVVSQVIAPAWTAYANKLAAGGDSVLARVAADELTRGLDMLRSHAAPGPIVEPIDVFVFR